MTPVFLNQEQFDELPHYPMGFIPEDLKWKYERNGAEGDWWMAERGDTPPGFSLLWSKISTHPIVTPGYLMGKLYAALFRA